jgi:hypothetical protein
MENRLIPALKCILSLPSISASAKESKSVMPVDYFVDLPEIRDKNMSSIPV